MAISITSGGDPVGFTTEVAEGVEGAVARAALSRVIGRGIGGGLGQEISELPVATGAEAVDEVDGGVARIGLAAGDGGFEDATGVVEPAVDGPRLLVGVDDGRERADDRGGVLFICRAYGCASLGATRRRKQAMWRRSAASSFVPLSIRPWRARFLRL